MGFVVVGYLLVVFLFRSLLCFTQRSFIRVRSSHVLSLLFFFYTGPRFGPQMCPSAGAIHLEKSIGTSRRVSPRYEDTTE